MPREGRDKSARDRGTGEREWHNFIFNLYFFVGVFKSFQKFNCIKMDVISIKQFGGESKQL